jgi:hypothetical protein
VIPAWRLPQSGDRAVNSTDDSGQVNLWSATPPVWLKLGMLLLNLLVWLDAAWRLAA